MSHEGGPESSQQRTVAELLAMYGGESGDRAPRRRRRRDDPSDTGAYSIVERVNSESSSKLTPVRDDQPPPNHASHRPRPPQHQQPSQPLPAVDPRTVGPRPPARPAGPPPTAKPVPQPGPPQPGPGQPGRPPHQAPPQLSGPPSQPLGRRPPAPPQNQPSQQLPQPSQQLPQPSQQLPRPGIAAPVPPNRPGQPPRSPRPGPPPQSMPSGSFPMSGGPRAPHGSGYLPAPPPPVRPPDAGMTEQMPRVAQQPPPVAPGRVTGTHQVPFPATRTGFGPAGSAPPVDDFTELAPDEDHAADDYEEYPDGEEFGGPDDYPDDYPHDDLDEDDLDERAPSAGREWLIMAAQVALSVVGGAAVWLGFNWLWGRYPQAALGAAVVVIIGLVWIVRKIRRAEDMQTTLLAILVGLFVTVSPAALLLLSK